jgi:hypothetical protein
VINNTLLNPEMQTANVFVQSDFGVISELTISNNMLVGGGYSIYAGNAGNFQLQGPVSITGNRYPFK